MIGALGPHDSLAVYDELIPFGLATENWMIVENETGEMGTGILLEEQCCGKPAHPSADDNGIKHLARVNRVWRQRIEDAIADLMPGG